MDIKNLNQFRALLIKNNKSVSECEYTKNNYDNDGNLIKESVPTITTDFCEIGLYNGEIYFVFGIDSKTFNLELFDRIKDKSTIQIYGSEDFITNLYPIDNFHFEIFIKQVQKDKCLQIQFDYKNISIFDLLTEYLDLMNIF